MALWLLLALLLLAGTGYAVSAPGARPPATGAEDFIAWLGPSASSMQRRSGLPASVVVAQGGLESGWGRSELAQRAGNLFGVKAGRSWMGPVISATTREYRNGEWVTVPGVWREFPSSAAAVAAGLPADSLFRVYRSPAAALEDHARVLYNGLYEAAMAYRTQPFEFARLIAPVYATDPAYAEKITATMRARDLTRWDVPPDQWQLDESIVPPRHRETWRAAMAARGVSV